VESTACGILNKMYDWFYLIAVEFIHLIYFVYILNFEKDCILS